MRSGSSACGVVVREYGYVCDLGTIFQPNNIE
jgi:hypothetical protein